jgi:hypothetical protein
MISLCSQPGERRSMSSKARGRTPTRRPPDAERGEQRPQDAARPAPPPPLLHLGRVVRRRRRYRRELSVGACHLGGRDGSRGAGAGGLGRAGRGLPQERHGAGAQAVVHPERRGRQARPLPRRGHLAADAAASPAGDRPESELLGGIHGEKRRFQWQEIHTKLPKQCSDSLENQEPSSKPATTKVQAPRPSSGLYIGRGGLNCG